MNKRTIPIQPRLIRNVLLGILLIVSMLVITPAFPAYAASYVVSNLNDSGAGSLREAITAALASPEDDTITFSVSGTINLATTLPDLTGGGGALTIDGTGQNITISGPGAGCSTDPYCRVFTSLITLNLINLTVTNGYVSGGGAGIFSSGTLNVTNCTISGNTAGNGAGGISTQGPANIVNSTISGNTSGIYNASGNLNVTNSTISGNIGRGISNGDGDLVVTHSTISANGGNGIEWVLPFGSVTLRNTIVANNTGHNCLAGIGSFTDGGYNLVWGDTTCPGTNDKDPKLLALADNGGPTWTHALDNGSAALEQIPSGTNGCGTTYTTDQRGDVRPGTRNQPTNKCEIGAWEAQAADPTAITLTSFRAAAPLFDLAAWFENLLRGWRR